MSRARTSGSTASRAGLVLAVLALLLACSDAQPSRLRRHRDAELSFVYPETWELVSDSRDPETPSGRVLVLRAAEDTVVMLHRFKPASGWRIEEFAQEFAQQRRREMAQQGAVRPQPIERSEVLWSARGQPLQGIRDDFQVEREGIVSRQTSLFFAVDRDGAQIFVSAHLPTPRLEALQPDLRALISSLRGGALTSRGVGGPTA